MARRVRKAIFPVAGLGTRFLPATKVMAKEMLPIVDKPLIQYAVEEAAAAGIEYFIFVTGRGKSVLVDHFDHAPELEMLLGRRGKEQELESLFEAMPDPGKVFSVRQQVPLGLGHAVWCAREFIGEEPFAVLLPDELLMSDVPGLKQLLDVHADVGGNLISVTEVPPKHTNRYGILDVESDDGKVAKAKGMLEKPSPEDAPSRLANIGRYVLDPAIFTHLDKQLTGAGGEIQLTDAIDATTDSLPFHGVRFDGERFDCGDKVGFLTANIAFALKRPEMSDQVRAAVAKLIA
ncbi:MAG: UTP--glucose-1-phosphate uridylyltransferase [Rhodospirillaceae bacterium]|nr:UTP--glucose-1-phosphate uridylyltransferase [Rhodospirillaceae bacterium]